MIGKVIFKALNEINSNPPLQSISLMMLFIMISFFLSFVLNVKPYLSVIASLIITITFGTASSMILDIVLGYMGNKYENKWMEEAKKHLDEYLDIVKVKILSRITFKLSTLEEKVNKYGKICAGEIYWREKRFLPEVEILYYDYVHSEEVHLITLKFPIYCYMRNEIKEILKSLKKEYKIKYISENFRYLIKVDNETLDKLINPKARKRGNTLKQYEYPEVNKLIKEIRLLESKELPFEIEYELQQIEKIYIPTTVSFLKSKQITQEEFEEIINTLFLFVKEKEISLQKTIEAKAFKNFILKKYFSEE